MSMISPQDPWRFKSKNFLDNLGYGSQTICHEGRKGRTWNEAICVLYCGSILSGRKRKKKGEEKSKGGVKTRS